MPSFPIDSSRAVMIATGKVMPVTEWTDDGRRTDVQKRDPNTGMPVWLIDCLVDDDDAARAVVAGVEVPALDEPKIAKFRPVVFEGLTMSCYVKRQTGALVTRWSAEGLAEAHIRPSAVAS